MEDLKIHIYTIRGQQVVLDSVLAGIYGVPAKVFNQAFKRNRKRFPELFAFQLEEEEWKCLRSQFVTLKKSGRGAHRKYLPWVFTEHGALMSANILNTNEAISASVFIIRAFIKIREDMMTNATLLKRLAEVEKTILEHDAALWDVYQKIIPLLQPPLPETKRLRGFDTGTDA